MVCWHKVPLMTLSGHSEGISSVAWIDESTLCSASLDHSIRLWDVQQAATASTFVCLYFCVSTILMVNAYWNCHYIADKTGCWQYITTAVIAWHSCTRQLQLAGIIIGTLAAVMSAAVIIILLCEPYSSWQLQNAVFISFISNLYWSC